MTREVYVLFLWLGNRWARLKRLLDGVASEIVEAAEDGWRGR